MVSTRLDRGFRVSNLLQDATILFEVLSEGIFLLTKLSEEDAEFIRYVGDRVIACGFTPVGELRCDGDALATGRLVGADSMIFTFDDFEKFLAQFGLLNTAQRGHSEAVLRRTLIGATDGRGIVLSGPD